MHVHTHTHTHKLTHHHSFITLILPLPFLLFYAQSKSREVGNMWGYPIRSYNGCGICSMLINPCNAYNINQDSGAWVLIFEGFWVLKLVFEWCRIHIKTVLAQHYSLVVFYPILLWFTYAWFIQANPVQVGPGPPKSAQVNPNPHVLLGSPRFSQEIIMISCDFGVSGISWENLGVIFCDFAGFPGIPGITWVLFSAILRGFREFLG